MSLPNPESDSHFCRNASFGQGNSRSKRNATMTDTGATAPFGGKLCQPVDGDRVLKVAGVGLGDDHEHRKPRFPSATRSLEQGTLDRPETSAEAEGRRG